MWLTESSLYNRFCIEGPQAYSTILQCTNVIECHWLALTVCYNLHDLVRYWAGSGSEFGFWNRIYTKLLNFTRISEEVTDGFRWNFNVSITAGVCTIWLGFEPDPDQSLDPGSGLTHSLTHCCACPAEGRSVLHIERSWPAIQAAPTDRPMSSSTCCSQFLRGRPGGRFQSAARGVPVWASIDSWSACDAGVFSGRRQMWPNNESGHGFKIARQI